MEKTLSRQRRWQLRQVENGLCSLCGRKKVFRGERCREHYKKNLETTQRWRERQRAEEARVG